jgi:ABC-type uncharacterized transport system substrate-binding protein
MRRRDFIKVVAGSIAAISPLVARAQPTRGQKMANVGILNYAAANDALVEEFRRALRQLGHVEGQTTTMTYRWADGNFDRLPALAEELVAQKVDVIIALGPAVWAAKRTTTTIPIVIAFSGDPVGDQVVPNFPGVGGLSIYPGGPDSLHRGWLKNFPAPARAQSLEPLWNQKLYSFSR